MNHQDKCDAQTKKSDAESAQADSPRIASKQSAADHPATEVSESEGNQIRKPDNTPTSFIKWNLIFDALLVIATFTSVGIASCQWRVMKEQSDTMVAQTKAAFQQVSAAKSSLKIANDAMEDNRKSGIEQSERAEKALNATLENFRAEQRAWVGLKLITRGSLGIEGPFIQEGQKLDAKICILNSGKSLARKVKISMTAQDVPAGVDPIKKQRTSGFSNIGVMQPEFMDFLTPPTIPAEGVATKSFIENITSGRKVIYLTGKITYEDTFQRPHFSTFCLQLRPDLSGFTACPFYNEAN